MPRKPATSYVTWDTEAQKQVGLAPYTDRKQALAAARGMNKQAVRYFGPNAKHRFSVVARNPANQITIPASQVIINPGKSISILAPKGTADRLMGKLKRIGKVARH